MRFEFTLIGQIHAVLRRKSYSRAQELIMQQACQAIQPALGRLSMVQPHVARPNLGRAGRGLH